jgi:MFS family permease
MPIDPPSYARRWKTLAVLSLSLLIIGLDNTILNVALPSLQEHFDASSSTLQWIVDSYLLVFAGLLLTMGTLGDRFGRKLRAASRPRAVRLAPAWPCSSSTPPTA